MAVSTTRPGSCDRPQATPMSWAGCSAGSRSESVITPVTVVCRQRRAGLPSLEGHRLGRPAVVAQGREAGVGGVEQVVVGRDQPAGAAGPDEVVGARCLADDVALATATPAFAALPATIKKSVSVSSPPASKSPPPSLVVELPLIVQPINVTGP